jgi:hypothetical protein
MRPRERLGAFMNLLLKQRTQNAKEALPLGVLNTLRLFSESGIRGWVVYEGGEENRPCAW